MKRAIILFLAILGIASCSNGIADEAAAAWEAWDELAPEGYRIMYDVRNRNGMGGAPGDGEYDVTVRGGRVSDCTVSDAPRDEDSSCVSRSPRDTSVKRAK